MINKVIKRYRSEMKSRALYTEIIVTIQEIAAILTEDGITCINFFYSDERNKNRDACLLYLNLLNHIINIFYSLNSQDFPEFFEDNLNSWMAILRASIDFTLNITDVPMNSLFLKVKKSSMKSLNLYCNNYYEDFSQFHNDYYASVWSLVQIIKHEQHYEKLIKELLVYYKILFQFRRCNLDSDSITLLINNLIIPEMRLTGKELDDFEDNPINFLKVELEESDMDSST
jgi:exportin-2 (importin alpha re-exporter)